MIATAHSTQKLNTKTQSELDLTHSGTLVCSAHPYVQLSQKGNNKFYLTVDEGLVLHRESADEQRSCSSARFQDSGNDTAQLFVPTNPIKKRGSSITYKPWLGRPKGSSVASILPRDATPKMASVARKRLTNMLNRRYQPILPRQTMCP